MDEPTRRMLAPSAKQCGFITRAQLIACGRTERQIDHALTTDTLTRVQFGVYQVTGSARMEYGDLIAALLFTDGVASHRSGAHLLGLIDSSPSQPEITVGAKQSPKAADLIIHRSRDLVPGDVCRNRACVAPTPPAR